MIILIICTGIIVTIFFLNWHNGMTSIPDEKLMMPSSQIRIFPSVDLIFDGYSGQPLIYVHRGETKIVDIIANLTKSNSTVYLENFNVNKECDGIDIQSQCVPHGMSISLSNDVITSTQHLQLIIKVPQNMTAGKYVYGISATAEPSLASSPDDIKYSKMLWNYFIWVED